MRNNDTMTIHQQRVAEARNRRILNPSRSELREAMRASDVRPLITPAVSRMAVAA